MRRRMPRLFLLTTLLATAGLAERVAIPLDPARLDGAAVFTDAESLVERAARASGLDFVPAPEPLPPEVLVILDTPDHSISRRGGRMVWRGDMLPDQLAPAETGVLLRKRRQADGAWKITRRSPQTPLASLTNLTPTTLRGSTLSLPAMIIETPFCLGTAGAANATLLLWRTEKPGTPPIGGAISLMNPTSELVDALRNLAPDFDGQNEWESEFDALLP